LGGIYIETFGLAGYPDDLQEVFIENSFLNLAGSQQTARRGADSASQPCTFNINITNVSLLTNDQVKKARDEITRIFATGRQNVVFNNPRAANGGSYYLTIQDDPPDSNDPEAIGSTPYYWRSGVAVVRNYGAVSTQRLTPSIKNVPDYPTQQQGMHPDNFAIGIGRGGAHEAGHYFLQIGPPHPKGDQVMNAAFTGRAWWSPSYNSTFKFNEEHTQKLALRCRLIRAFTFK
jgi:hypothetical protein